MMLTMDNGCGVIGDVSYFAPDSIGYALPFYWRMTFWGRQGVIETSRVADDLTIALNGKREVRSEPHPDGRPGGYLKSFIHDIEGNLDEDELCTEHVFSATRVALTVQQAADTHAREVVL